MNPLNQRMLYSIVRPIIEVLPSFAKALDSHRGMTSEDGTLRSSVRSVVGYASEGSAPKHVKKPPGPAGGASLKKGTSNTCLAVAFAKADRTFNIECRMKDKNKGNNRRQEISKYLFFIQRWKLDVRYSYFKTNSEPLNPLSLNRSVNIEINGI